MAIEITLENKKYFLELNIQKIEEIVYQKYPGRVITLKILVSEETPKTEKGCVASEIVLIHRRYNKEIAEIFGFAIPSPNDAQDSHFNLLGDYSSENNIIRIFPVNMIADGITIEEFKAALICALIHELGHKLDAMLQFFCSPFIGSFYPIIHSPAQDEINAYKIAIFLLQNCIDEWLKCVEIYATEPNNQKI